MTLVLHGATVITMDPERRVLADGAVAVQDDRIVAVGPTTQVLEVTPQADRLDCSGQVVIPGLVNTHTHLFQTLLKGLGDDLVLQDWFLQMTGPSAAQLTPDDVLAAARHGAVESIKSGTTTIADFMYVHPVPGLTDRVIEGLEDVGIRGLVGRGFMTTGADLGVPAALIEHHDDALADASRLIDRHNGTGSTVEVALAPTMIWTVDREALRATRQLADATGARIMMHVAETPFEGRHARTEFGGPEVDVLEATGLLGPDLLAVHAVHCTATDIEVFVRCDVKVSHNPCSNLYLASGIAPVPEFLAAGLAVGLATDGPASSNNHNMIHALKFAALTQKGHRQDATVITAETVLEMATCLGAAALGMEDEIGSIEVGKKGDLVVLDLGNAFAAPVHDPVSALVYSALGSEPRTVLVDGRVVLSEGALTTVDEQAVRRAAEDAAAGLADRAGTAHLTQRAWRSVSRRPVRE